MGKLVTIEGGEGAGKTTLIENLKKYFVENHIDFVATREPGGSKVCENIRNILKYSDEKISERAEILLFSASRAQLVDEFIKPKLAEGKIVVCDRFFDSTRVYQGFAGNFDDKEIMDITNFATNGLLPDITFYLDIDPVVAFKRKGGQDKGDRIEERDMSYHQKVRQGFLELVKREDRIVKLDATLSEEELLTLVVSKLKQEKIIE